MRNGKSPVEATGKISQGKISHQKNKKRQQNGGVNETDRQKTDCPKQFQPQKSENQRDKLRIMNYE